MFTAQVFLTLWVACLATAQVSQDQVVSQVVTALGPAVQRAVAEALAGLQQTSNLDVVERASFETELAKNNIVEVTARPVYNYEYKVADDTAQTYISQTEERDGDNLSGSYSYVDASGALVTVNYEAGAMGYSEDRQVQDGYVAIRAKPVSSVSVGVSGQTESQDSATISSYKQSQSQELLISQILSTLQPLIATTVQDVISSSSSSSSSSLTSSSVSSEDSDTASTFGTGVSVSVATPDFQFRI